MALQIRVRDLFAQAAATGAALPVEYDQAMRLWFALGWPAFIGLIAVFMLMIARPDLW
ncbi:MAG: DUF2269 family protein [Enhydrobacter sp.]|nr:DUF2269 family protein [Enhydrobacter sp.]